MFQESGENIARTILVVDDEEDIVTYLTTLLNDNGYCALGARNTAAALDAIRTCTPDLILLDILMPGQSGLSLYRTLRRSRETARVPVLFISGLMKLEEWSDLPENAAAEFADQSNFLEKPIPVDKLLQRIRELLSRIQEEPS